MLSRLRQLASPPAAVWPSLEDEIGEYRIYLKRKVLNAGAGMRGLTTVVDGELVNQDIPREHRDANMHIYSPIHESPSTTTISARSAMRS